MTRVRFLQPRPENQVNELVCQICGDAVGVNQDNELFVACNECAFPVCRTCYEYERKEGNGVCPHCKTRYKRLKGEVASAHSARVLILRWETETHHREPSQKGRFLVSKDASGVVKFRLFDLDNRSRGFINFLTGSLLLWDN